MTGHGKLFELPEIIDFHEVKDDFTRSVMILMALTTLLGGTVEFLHSRAATEGERAGIEAQELGVQAMGEFVRVDQFAQAEYEKFAMAAEERTRRSNTLRQRFLPVINGLPANTRPADLEIARLDALIKRTENLLDKDIRLDGRYGPAADLVFPDQFFASKQGRYWRLWAGQDAANEEFFLWKRQQSVYTTVLTLYAAALYLFGLALAIQLPVRVTLTRVAVLLVAVGSGWAGWTFIHQPSRMSEADATAYAKAYADGKQTLYAAHRTADYVRAKHFFTQAIDKRTTFAQAYQDRATATFEIGSPQHMGLPGLTDLPSLRAAEDDEAHALKYGLSNPTLLTSHGNNLFLLALEGDASRSKAFLARSIAETGRAIDMDPEYPLQYYNLAETYLANRDFARARETFGKAVALTLARQGHRFRFNRGRQQLFVSGVLTDLESIVRALDRLAPAGAPRDALACEVRATREFVVGSVSMGTVQPLPLAGSCPAAAPPLDARIVLYPVSLRWSAKLGRFERGRDVLSVQWYYRDPAQRKWMALPDVSLLGTSAIDRDGSDLGTFYDETTYLTETTPPTCVPDGEFRVDLYQNGWFIGSSSKETPPTYARMKAVLRRDLNAGFCVPDGWTPERSAPGFVAAYRSPDHTRGVVLLRFHYPWTGAEIPKDRVVDRYLTLALERVLHFPRGEYAQTEAPAGFVELGFAQKNGYRLPDGEAVAQFGVVRDGAIIVNVVYGPRAYIETNREAGDVFSSLMMFSKGGPGY